MDSFLTSLFSTSITTVPFFYILVLLTLIGFMFGAIRAINRGNIIQRESNNRMIKAFHHQSALLALLLKAENIDQQNTIKDELFKNISELETINEKN